MKSLGTNQSKHLPEAPYEGQLGLPFALSHVNQLAITHQDSHYGND